MSNRSLPTALSVRPRAVVRGLASAALARVVVGLAAFPAAADEGLGERSSGGMTPVEIVLVFVGIPAAVFAIVVALVYGFSRNDEPRLREGQSWWTEPDYNTRVSVGVQNASETDADAPRTTDGGGAGAGW